ncbi:hypothetical protein Droror1_Dr00017599, partial [Drosera rotundifolia]
MRSSRRAMWWIWQVMMTVRIGGMSISKAVEGKVSMMMRILEMRRGAPRGSERGILGVCEGIEETLDAAVGMVEKLLQSVDGGIERFFFLDDLLVVEDLVVAQTTTIASHPVVAGSTMQTVRFLKDMNSMMKDNRCLNQLLK